MHRKLTIVVEPLSEWNPQARIFIDGKDWLGPEFSGLDPEMLKTELLDKGVGTLLVGQCWCGSIGCRALDVEVKRNERSVEWIVSRDTWLRFSPAQYDAEVARFAQDRSWETIGRTLEREIEPLFRGTSIKGGFQFQWLSARGLDGFVHLSFVKDRRQKLLKFPWDGIRLSDGINRARVFREERFSHCE